MSDRTERMLCPAARLGATLLVTLLALTLAHSQTAGQDQGKGGAGATQAKYGLQVSDPRAFQGYTLFSPLGSTKFYLLDMQGRVVREWEGAATPASSAYLLENGNVLRPCLLTDKAVKMGGTAGPKGGRVQEFTWDGELVWDYKCSAERIQHHDVIKLPNGNVLMLAWDNKTAAEAAEAGRRSGDNVQIDCLIEVRPTGKTTGEIVWEWRLWDHLIQDHDKDKANYGDVAAHPELVDFNFGAPKPKPKKDGSKDKGPGGPAKKGGNTDWTHVNGLSYNAALDQIMMSCRTFSELWIIDHSTTTAEAAGHAGGKSGKGGDLLYRWGNPQTYRAGTAKDQQLFNQHHTHWIPKGFPGEGNALIFNNGNNRPGGNSSSVDEIRLPVDPQGRYSYKLGAPFLPEKPLWSYTSPNKKEFFSNFISGAQRLPNGNTLICSGAQGTLFEVTPEQEIVWKYINPVLTGKAKGTGIGGSPPGGNVFRATRYAPDYPALAGKDLKPGKTVEEMLKDGK